MTLITTGLLGALALWLVLVTGYLIMLTIAAAFGRRGAPPDGPALRRFGILVPAHNEELLLGRLLDNLERLDYPRSNFEICVVADNSSDRTAAVAHRYRCRVFERHDRESRGKGFALRWLLQTLKGEGLTYDAFVILDADSVVSPNLLRCFDSRLEAGSQVIQAYYSVLNPDHSPVATLRFVALSALHYLRPAGRAALGLSCGLKGNGMCFGAPVMEAFAWNWFTLAEDVEFHLELVGAGIRVDFAPQTVVWADMPTTWKQARSQNERWEKGRLLMLHNRIPHLAWAGLRHGNWMRLDAAIEQCLPPQSVPFALGWVCLIAALAFGHWLPAALAGFSVAGQTAYLLAGLIMVRAPWYVYRALAFAPFYVAWKLWIFGQALVSPRNTPWIRTARSGSEPDEEVSRPDNQALAS